MLKVVAIATVLNLAVTVSNIDVNDFSQINQFALKLLNSTYAFQEEYGSNNFAISPLSAWSIFTLLALSSTGDTYQELMRELRLPNDFNATQALHVAVNNIVRHKNQDVILKRKNAIFFDNSLEIYPNFSKIATECNINIYFVNFSNTITLENKINCIISHITDGKLISVIEPNLLENLKMILVDTLYLKASWTHSFNANLTNREEFFDYQGNTTGYVNMMHHTAPHYFGYSNEIEAEVLEMTYGLKEEFSMLILLPLDEIPLNKLLNNLATRDLKWMTEYKSDENPSEIECFIPRFKLSSQINLIPPLKYTGIKSLFDADNAQLPGISDSNLFVSKTIQKVKLEVNEGGTIAAAATVTGLEDRNGLNFNANKEFVFLITERTSNVILFAGVYSKPSLE